MGRPLNLHKYGSVRDVKTETIVQVQAYINGSAQNGYLYQQKNNNTFLVTTTVNPTLPLTTATSAVCKFANVAVPTSGLMSCQATTNASSTFYISRITNKFVWDFTAESYSGSTTVPGDQKGVKYRWSIPTIKPDAAITDYPSYLQVVLPSASKPASSNEAP